MTKTRDLSDFLIEGGADLPLGKPHIVPGILYPAVEGKDINGTALSSYTYGDLHAGTGVKYYYTDIKGSKPIKDPRIGAHFGSQRHKTKSIQILEQETATHGVNVYSVDGREWIRAVGTGVTAVNGSSGSNIAFAKNTGSFVEIVGYFNDAIVALMTDVGQRDITYKLNGGSESSILGTAPADSPLRQRYVDATSQVHLNLGATLGINTIRIGNPSTTRNDDPYIYHVELIVQDTASTARRSEIKIPKQNVVSFGKKFEVGSDDLDNAVHPHYDPFSAKTDGSAWTSPTSGNNTANSAASWPTNIDTTYSLGLENWVNGSSYYRPYNGGRVVKYVDSTGVIKTAVTVMPPNARSIGNAANLSGGAEKGDDSGGNTSAAAPNDNFKPTFTDQTIATAQDLYEVAKTFHYREFGNGAANEGSTTSGTKQDFSMLNSADTVSYVMDDGLTSMSGTDVTGADVRLEIGNSNNDSLYVTFIGTGIHYTGGHTGDPGPFTVAKNLPYGTHILRINRLTSSSDTGQLFIDGVNVFDQPSGRYGMRYPTEFSIYQPKRPPIPEDACVLADYMLMADFVPLSGTGSQANISKGVRLNSASRDVFYDETDGDSFVINAIETEAVTGMNVYLNGLADSTTSAKMRLPSFATNYVVRGYRMEERARLFIGDTDKDAVSHRNDDTNRGSYAYITNNSGNSATISSNETLGVNNFGLNAENNKDPYIGAFEIVTPIHTSFHYQTFEAPFTHELVGGDRNMEQHNLVCSPDGKTWDEVTRDTSYIGKAHRVQVSETTHYAWTEYVIFTDWRGRSGSTTTNFGLMNKDFAISYDRMICLVDGVYRLSANNYSTTATSNLAWYVNGDGINLQYAGSANSPHYVDVIVPIARGDFVQLRGEFGTGGNNNNVVSITKV